MKSEELEIIELKITIKAKSGEVFKIDMNNEVQRMMLSSLFNFYTTELPLELETKK